MRLSHWRLIVLIAGSGLCGCRGNEPDKSAQPLPGTVVDASSASGVAVQPSGTPAIEGQDEYRDSASVFVPDGYYLPERVLTVAGSRLTSLQLRTVEYYYGGQLHYERPKILQPPEVVASLSPASRRVTAFPCKASAITPDSLAVECSGTGAGDLVISGHFLDKSGWYWNQTKFEDGRTVLLVARVVASKNGKTIADVVSRFTYTAGD